MGPFHGISRQWDMDSKGLGTSRTTRWRDFELLRWKRVQTYSKRNMSLTSRLLPVNIIYTYMICVYTCMYVNIFDCVCNMSICISWTNGVALLYQYYCIHTQWVDLRLCAHLKKAPVSISQSKTLRFFAFLPKTGADFGEAFHLWSARPKNQWFTISGGTNPADSSPVSRLWAHPCWLGHLYSTWIANGQQDFLLVFVAFFFYISKSSTALFRIMFGLGFTLSSTKQVYVGSWCAHL